MKKNVIITGASGNLGKATVEKFLSEGYNVVALVTPGKKLGFPVIGNIDTYEADLTNEKSSEEVIHKILQKYQTVDTALLLVGGFAAGNIFATDSRSLQKMYSLNFETAYFIARPIFSQMAKQQSGGRIIFIGARPALRAKDGKNLLAYALSKSLIFTLSECLNAEGADKNIVSTVIVPSTIDTVVNRQAMPNADFSLWVTPEQIAEVIAFSTSDQSNALRESVLKVYGNS